MPRQGRLARGTLAVVAILAITASVIAILAGAGAAPALSSAQASSPWVAPVLRRPTIVRIDARHTDIRLNQHKDYVLICPLGPDRMRSGPIIAGGRNVVLQDCDIDVTGPYGGMVIEDQTGEIWLHDVHVGGRRLTQGIDLQDPGATVVMRDVLVDEVHGGFHTNHAELIQTWAGPARLLIDGFQGSTTYQGFFLLPNQWYDGPSPRVFDFRNVYIDDSRGAYALWRGGNWPLHLQNVYVKPNPVRTWRGWWLWPQPSSGDRSWRTVRAGAPPGGGFVWPTAYGATGVDEGLTPPPLPGGKP